MGMAISVGQKFGAWTVIAEGTKAGKLLCRCDCGRTEHEIREYDLVKGSTLMCRRCSVATSKKSHGASPYGKASGEYNTWSHMIQRCHNPNNKDYKNYGARGIQVCDLWRDSFETFLLMVGKRPTPQHTIERIDYDKGYEPDNVKWATRTEQNRNTRANVKLTINGETKTVAEWSQDPKCTVDMFCIYKRIRRDWDEEEAVFAPNGFRRGQYGKQ